LVPYDSSDFLNVVRNFLGANQFNLTMHSESFGGSTEYVPIMSKLVQEGEENTFTLEQFPCGVSSIQAFNKQGTNATGALQVIRKCNGPVL
jgi:hypothetical protein